MQISGEGTAVAEPANRSDRPGGGKIYTHPATQEIFDSVTSVLEGWDKEGLKIWAGQLAAAAALDLIPQLVAAAIVEDCGNTFNRCYQKHGRDNRCERCPCRVCERCWYQHMAFKHSAESARRSEEGTECHAAINHWVSTGGDRITLRKEVQPYFDTFLLWVRDYGLEASMWEQTEATVLNRDYMVAGTSDGALRIERHRMRVADEAVDRVLRYYTHPRQGNPPVDPELVEIAQTGTIIARVDYKTREKEDERLFNDMPLQGVAYERCPVVMLPDGRELPALRTHVRAVLQLRPGGAYSFKPMVSDEPEWHAFLGLLAAYRWKQERGGKNAFDLDNVVPLFGQLPPTEAEREQIRAFYGSSNIRPLPDLPGTPAPAVPPPVAPPAKKTAKKAAPKKASATSAVDPFALGQDGPDRSAILASMSRTGGAGAFPAGQPQLAAFDEDVPF